MFDRRILTIRIKADLKNYNTGQTKHWSTAHREKKAMTLALRDGWVTYPGDGNLRLNAFLNEIMTEPFSKMVDISVKRILGKGQRLLDPDSLTRGNCKQLIDSIVDEKILADDSAKYVGRVLGLQTKAEPENGPAIEITFWEHENEPSIGGS